MTQVAHISLTPEQAEHALFGVERDHDEALNETLRQLVQFVVSRNPSYFPRSQ